MMPSIHHVSGDLYGARDLVRVLRNPKNIGGTLYGQPVRWRKPLSSRWALDEFGATFTTTGHPVGVRLHAPALSIHALDHRAAPS